MKTKTILPMIYGLFFSSIGCMHYQSIRVTREQLDKTENNQISARFIGFTESSLRLEVLAKDEQICRYRTRKTFFKKVPYGNMYTYVKTHTENIESKVCGPSNRYSNLPIKLCVVSHKKCFDIGSLDQDGFLSKKLKNIFQSPEDLSQPVTIVLSVYGKIIKQNVQIPDNAISVLEAKVNNDENLQALIQQKKESIHFFINSTSSELIKTSLILILANSWMENEQIIKIFELQKQFINDTHLASLIQYTERTTNDSLYKVFSGEMSKRESVRKDVVKPVVSPSDPADLVIDEKIDTDGDGILNTDDLCPNEKEDVDGFADEDGCPDPGAH